jgi:hypothetical protein
MEGGRHGGTEARRHEGDDSGGGGVRRSAAWGRCNRRVLQVRRPRPAGGVGCSGVCACTPTRRRRRVLRLDPRRSGRSRRRRPSWTAASCGLTQGVSGPLAPPASCRGCFNTPCGPAFESRSARTEASRARTPGAASGPPAPCWRRQEAAGFGASGVHL